VGEKIFEALVFAFFEKEYLASWMHRLKSSSKGRLLSDLSRIGSKEKGKLCACTRRSSSAEAG